MNNNMEEGTEGVYLFNFHQLKVLVYFFSPKEGGRKNSIILSNQYQPHFRVINDSEYLGIAFVEEHCKPIKPDEWILTVVNLVYYPSIKYEKLISDIEFEILEGGHVVGKGKVIEVCN